MEWISVKDYMPEPYDTVLLFEDGKNSQAWFGHFDCATNEMVYYFGGDVRSDKNITHWMPLPAPPEGENE